MNPNDKTALRESFDRTRDRAVSGAHKGIDTAASAVHPAVDRITAGAHQAVNTVDDAAARTADVLASKGQKLRDAQSRFAESCSASICERPLSSVGIAVAAGFLLALILGRR
jgi:ElaB/YqjD/DUF883 family membrane-anchored ribosome-binding protein